MTILAAIKDGAMNPTDVIPALGWFLVVVPVTLGVVTRLLIKWAS
jgi:hypothetical protein